MRHQTFIVAFFLLSFVTMLAILLGSSPQCQISILPPGGGGEGENGGTEGEMDAQDGEATTELTEGEEFLVEEFIEPEPEPEPVEILLGTQSGTIELPSGSTLDPSTVSIVNSLGSTTSDSSGDFSLDSYQSGPQLTIALSPGGTPMLMGWLDDAHPTLSAQSTAEALLYFALGAFTLTEDVRDIVIDRIAELPELQPLTDAISNSLVADPDSFASDNSTVATALQGVIDAIKAANGLSARASDLVAVLVSRGVMVNPGDERSGLVLNIDPMNSVHFTNRFRRLSYAFIDRVSYTPKGGSEVPSPASLTGFEVPAVIGLSDTTGTFVDIIYGRMAGEELSTSPVYLPLVENSENTKYKATVVGPGSMQGDLSMLTAEQLNKQQEITQTFVVRDLFLPLVLNLLIPNSSADDVLSFIGGSGVVKDLVNSLTVVAPKVWERAYAGDMGGALYEARQALMTSDTFRNYTLQKLLDAIRNSRGWDVGDAALGHAQHLLKALGAVDALLASFDATAVGVSIGGSNMADIWNITVTPPDVNLTPERSRINNSRRAYLTVEVADSAGVDLVYRWTNTANYGHLTDDIWWSDHQDNFDSTSKNVTYTANEEGEGTDTITVEVLMLSGPGGHGRTSVGTDQAQVVVTKELICSDMDFSGYQSGCGSVGAPSVVRAGDTITVSVNSGCGGLCGNGGWVSCSYALPDVVVDGVSRTVGSGSAPLYDYAGWGSPQPGPRGGAMVDVECGSHTIQFTIDPMAPNDCVYVEGLSADGPWVVLGTGLWSSPVPFRVNCNPDTNPACVPQ